MSGVPREGVAVGTFVQESLILSLLQVQSFGNHYT